MSSEANSVCNRWRWALALVAVCLLAGIWIPDFIELDEAIYGEVARNMLESGQWLRPEWNGQIYPDKPLFFYWLLAALYWLFGLMPAVGRVVSAAATVAGVAFLARRTARSHGGAAAETAVWVAGASLLPFFLGRLGMVDALLTASLTVALLSFWAGIGAANSKRDGRLLLLGYAATGVAMAAKGPGFPVLVAAVLLVDALWRRDVTGTLRRSGLSWGLPVVLILGLPANLPLFIAEGGEFLLKHNIQRALTPMHGHSGPVWYYLPILLFGLLPFTAHLPRALGMAGGEATSTRRLARFCLAWVVVVVGVFSLAATKLPHYIAAVWPPVAILLGVHAARQEGRPRHRAWTVTGAAAIFAAIFLMSLPVLAARADTLFGPRVAEKAPEVAHLPLGPKAFIAMALAGALLVVGSFLGWNAARGGRHHAAFRFAGTGACLAWATLWVALGHGAAIAWQQPLRLLAVEASRGLPAGEPIHLLEMNHRVIPNLATGRHTVFWRARRPEHIEHLRVLLGGEQPARLVVPGYWWDRLAGDLRARELLRNGPYVLVGEAGPGTRPELAGENGHEPSRARQP